MRLFDPSGLRSSTSCAEYTSWSRFLPLCDSPFGLCASLIRMQEKTKNSRTETLCFAYVWDATVLPIVLIFGTAALINRASFCFDRYKGCELTRVKFEASKRKPQWPLHCVQRYCAHNLHIFFSELRSRIIGTVRMYRTTTSPSQMRAEMVILIKRLCVRLSSLLSAFT